MTSYSGILIYAMFETDFRTQDIYSATPKYMKQINNNNIGRCHKALSKTFSSFGYFLALVCVYWVTYSFI